MTRMTFPPPLRRGDRVRIIAPAGPFERTLFWRGAGWLAQHFRVCFEPEVRARTGFVAGSVERRLAELNRALHCPESKALFCARGGVGSTELLLDADFAALSRHPKWLIGFSDVTALLNEALRVGVAAVHGPNVTTLGRACPAVRDPLLALLLEPRRVRRIDGLKVLFPGAAEGTLIGGNLSLVHDLLASGRLLCPAGAVLFVEELHEPPYRLARMLQALVTSGIRQRLAGMLVGQISHSHAGRYGVHARQVFESFARAHRLPCWWGLAAGHEPTRHIPLVLGGTCRLRPDGSVELGP